MIFFLKKFSQLSILCGIKFKQNTCNSNGMYPVQNLDSGASCNFNRTGGKVNPKNLSPFLFAGIKSSAPSNLLIKDIR